MEDLRHPEPRKSSRFCETPAVRARRIPVVQMTKYPSKLQMAEFLSQIDEINKASQRGKKSPYLSIDRKVRARSTKREGIGAWTEFHWHPKGVKPR